MPRLSNGLNRIRLAQAVESYQRQLESNHPWQDYLASRGILGPVARKYRLGYVGVAHEGHESYVGALSIPYLAGNPLSGLVPVGLRFRLPPSSWDGPKYLSLWNDDRRLFNVSVLFHPPRRVLVCEGEFDAIVATEIAGVSAVGVAGVHTWRDEFVRLLADVQNIVIVGDGDKAGYEFNKRVREELKELPSVHMLRMPEGYDITSYLQAHGQMRLTGFLNATRYESATSETGGLGASETTGVGASGSSP